MNAPFQQHWRKRRFLFFPLIIIGLFTVSAVVMLLWNSIIPGISTLSALTFWQAMGLFLLCRILFHSFHFRHNHNSHHRFVRAAFKDKFMNMSDEERQQFKDQWKQRCCSKD